MGTACRPSYMVKEGEEEGSQVLYGGSIRQVSHIVMCRKCIANREGVQRSAYMDPATQARQQQESSCRHA